MGGVLCTLLRGELTVCIFQIMFSSEQDNYIGVTLLLCILLVYLYDKGMWSLVRTLKLEQQGLTVLV